MRYNNSSPTSAIAIGNVERELRQKKKEAERIRALYLSGRLTAEEEAAARRRFTGIFRRLLDEALSGK